MEALSPGHERRRTRRAEAEAEGHARAEPLGSRRADAEQAGRARSCGRPCPAASRIRAALMSTQTS